MNKPIRILHCFGRMDRGGAETLVMNIYRSIDREKVQFDFVVHTNEKFAYDDEIYSLGGRIYNVPRYNIKNHFEYRDYWKKLFVENKGEWKMIHGHLISTASIYLRLAEKYGLTTIAHSHSTSSGTGVSAIVKDLLQSPIKNIANYLFACSKSAGQWLFGDQYCKKNNFYILKNAIDLNKFKYNANTRFIKRKELFVENKFVIGHIGRITEPKNHIFLIDIFKEVHHKNPSAVLLLVGDGSLRQLIEEKVDKLGLSQNVIFTGVRSDTPELLQAMDVFVFPSNYEGLGIAAVEAQASGLHCIVSDRVPEEAYLTNLVEVESLKSPPSKWADRILQYVDGYERTNTSEQIKTKGYDIEEISKWLVDFYLK